MPFIFGWLLNGAYSLLLLAVAPVLVYRRLRFGKYRGGWREKLTGRLTRKHPDRRCLWFHAVSVGEVLQLQKVLDETAARFADAELFVTTTTDTGYDVARTKYPQHTVAYFPLDFTWAVARALDSIRPDLVVLVELELWPNFVFQCRRSGIPLSLINGRIGEKSFRGYSRIKPLIRRVLGAFDCLAVQNETYAGRLQALGAEPGRIVVTGNIKFDRVESDRANPRTMELRRAFCIQPHEQVFIAGSTQSPEELYALDAWIALRAEFPGLFLVLVPRHQERGAEVGRDLTARGVKFVFRTEVTVGVSRAPGEVDCLLVNTTGELRHFYERADIVFVGKSLTAAGGQNPIEPAALGKAVVFGPHMQNFPQIVPQFVAADAVRQVKDATELERALSELLADAGLRAELGTRARAVVEANQGGIGKTVDMIVQAIAK